MRYNKGSFYSLWKQEEKEERAVKTNLIQTDEVHLIDEIVTYTNQEGGVCLRTRE
jgi:hypothetical protein